MGVLAGMAWIKQVGQVIAVPTFTPDQAEMRSIQVAIRSAPIAGQSSRMQAMDWLLR
jgi:hypothetical protein